MKRTFPIVIKGHPGIGEPVEGRALVADDGFSARYDLDRINGTFSRRQHKLHGESYLDKIVILARAKGGVATAWMFFEMASRNRAPKGMVLNFANPIMAQGAAFANLALMDRPECDVTGQVLTGDLVRLDPEAGTLTIMEGS